MVEYIQRFFLGDSVANYVEVGFSDAEAEALTWIAEQKPKGKLYGLMAGSFLAFSWGHWHNRIINHLPFKFSRFYTYAALIGMGIWVGDYVYCVRRYGANQYIANKFMLNNNLFNANLDSLIQNFQILNRKFTPEEIVTFNQRAVAMKSLQSFAEKKWVFNENIETQQQFERRVKLNISAPWEDSEIRRIIREQNPSKSDIIYAPTDLTKIIDHSGKKIGIVQDYTFGWKPLQ